MAAAVGAGYFNRDVRTTIITANQLTAGHLCGARQCVDTISWPLTSCQSVSTRAPIRNINFRRFNRFISIVVANYVAAVDSLATRNYWRV